MQLSQRPRSSINSRSLYVIEPRAVPTLCWLRIVIADLDPELARPDARNGLTMEG